MAMQFRMMITRRFATQSIGVLFLLLLMAPCHADPGEAQVMQAFVADQLAQEQYASVSERGKRIVMFAMGVPLLLLLIATTALGVAMGVYRKQVFVAHMVCAGLSVTLATAHAIVGIVWFYPF